MSFSTAQLMTTELVGGGFIVFNTASHYVYPVIFKSRSEIDHFNQWLISRYGAPIDDYPDDDLYHVFQVWVSAQAALRG